MQVNQQFVIGSTSLWWKSPADAVPAPASTFNSNSCKQDVFSFHSGLISRRTADLYGALILWLAYLAATCQGAQSVSLAWDPSTDSDVAGYAVYWGDASGARAQRLDVGLNTSATIPGLQEGSTNYFVVTAYNVASVEGASSPELSYLVPGALTMSMSWQPGGAVTLKFPVLPGHWYEVLATQDLKSWISLWQSPVQTANTWQTFADTQTAGKSQRYYRTVQH